MQAHVAYDRRSEAALPQEGAKIAVVFKGLKRELFEGLDLRPTAEMQLELPKYP